MTIPRPVNVLEVLKMPLPRVVRNLPIGKRRRMDTLKGKTKMLAPLRAWQSPTEDYSLTAASLWYPRLEKIQFQQESLRVIVQDPLEHSILETEGDVVALARNPLADPVTRAVQNLFKKPLPSGQLMIRHKQQSHKPDIDEQESNKLKDDEHGSDEEEIDEKKSDKEKSSRLSTRVDSVWEVWLPGSKKWTEFAILEYKNTNIIMKSEFEEGNWDERSKDYGKTLSKPGFSTLAFGRKRGTFLKGNAINLSKQAISYSKRSPFVAMFDWDTLLCVDFDGMDQESNQPVFAKMTFVHDGIGLALLGFVVKGLQHKLREHNIDPTQWCVVYLSLHCQLLILGSAIQTCHNLMNHANSVYCLYRKNYHRRFKVTDHSESEHASSCPFGEK